MTVLVQDPDFTLHVGDALETLRALPDGSVDCCVTSPPYWGLRDYGTDGQLGLEPTPDAYVAAIVDVFREVRRVLSDSGTLWLNLGDSYASDIKGTGGPASASTLGRGCDGSMRMTAEGIERTLSSKRLDPVRLRHGLKQKDLVGIPWRVAFALQQDGWWLRSDIIWSKPNPMPESVRDRPTKAHEMVFLLTKGPWNGPERGQFGDISDEDARWLALLFDTEGNIVIKRAANNGRTQYGAQMAFANCSRDLLERARAIVGMGSLHERRGKNAPVFYWQMTGRQARDLLYRIYPFLIVKQRQARVAIHMQDVVAEPKKRPGGYRSTEHEAFLERCWQTVKALNRFGDPDISWVPVPRYGKWGPTRYFFDQEAVREPAEWARWGDQKYSPAAEAMYGQRIPPRRKSDLPGVNGRNVQATNSEAERRDQVGGSFNNNPRLCANVGRNVRSVWEIATEPYPEAHFATFPTELARRCILAGCPEWVCGTCGKARERIVEREDVERGVARHPTGRADKPYGTVPGSNTRGVPFRATLGESWSDCGHNNYRPGVVLDPFGGSGTTALVARRHGRKSVLIELNPAYVQLAARRLQQLSLLAEATP